MRIAIVTTSLTQGGAQRVAATLANGWVAKGHAVHVITFEPPGTKPDFPLDPQVSLEQLDLTADSASSIASVAKNLRRVSRIRGNLAAFAPDVVLGLITGPNILTVLSGLGQSWPSVISERVHPGHMSIGRAWSGLRRATYPMAAAIVVQSSDIARWFEQELRLRTVIIPNPVDLKKFAAVPPVVPSRPRLRAMAAGRLDPQKGYDVLIEAFARVAGANPLWDLVIYGMGPHRERLEAQISKHALSGRITLPGQTLDIVSAYGEADLFVHSARFEGSPNVIQEALAAGRPVVATDCPGYSAELLGHGRYGILVPPDDVDALAQALARLLPDHDARVALAAGARSAVLPLSTEVIADRWLALFRDVIDARHGARARERATPSRPTERA